MGINSNLKLCRTDSTTLCFNPYKKKVESCLSPLGRERRIKRLDKLFIKEYRYIYK